MDAKPMEIPEGFTPGPWQVEGPDANRHEPCWRFISSPKGNWYHFANVAVAKLIDGRAVDNPEGAANAALIAMAPDMAAEILALRAAVRYMTDEALRLRDERDDAIDAAEHWKAERKLRERAYDNVGKEEELLRRAEKAEAERDALAARLAVPGVEELARPLSEKSALLIDLLCADDVYPAYGGGVRITFSFSAEAGLNIIPRVQAARAALADALTALRARVAGLEGAMTALLTGDYPRPVGKAWFPDERPSKNDQCTHGVWMYEVCEGCIDAFIEAALSPSAQEARDAE